MYACNICCSPSRHESKSDDSSPVECGTSICVIESESNCAGVDVYTKINLHMYETVQKCTGAYIIIVPEEVQDVERNPKRKDHFFIL
jgi:hypothetical protein